jgi:HEAT repeat protein
MNNSSFDSLLEQFSIQGKHPELITEFQLLNSEDKSTREQAEEYLFSLSYHQGDIGIIAPFVIPFFLDRLDRETDLKILESLLIELACMASGSSYIKEIDEIADEESHKKARKRRRTNIQRLFRETQAALSHRLDRYFNFLAHDAAFIRSHAVYLLMYCQFHVENIIRVLRSTFERERDEDVKSLIIFAMVILSDRNSLEIDTDFLNDILNSSTTDSVKLAAAIALTHIQEENIKELAFSQLLALSKKDGMWEHLRIHESALPCYILHFVDRLNDEQTFQLVDAMLQGWSLYHSVDDLILLVFKCDNEDDFWEEKDIKDLSKLQLHFLEKVAAAENVSYNSTLGNLLMTFGIRDRDEQNRDGLIKLLSNMSL